MSHEGFFFQAFVYLIAAVISVLIAKRLGLGSVLGYLLAGVIIGPFVLGLIGEEGEDIMHFAEFGVVMMLFLVGLELEPTMLWRLRAPILGLGGLQVVVTALVVAVLSLATGIPWKAALAIGMIASLSSTAIVLQTLNEKGLMKTTAGQSSFAVLLFQDIAFIPMLAVFPLLAMHTAGGHDAHGSHDAAHASTTWVEGLPPWAQTLAVLAAVVAIIMAGRFLLQPAFRAIARTRMREMFTAAALLLIISIALLMTKVGLSPALGTFLAGVVLANSEYRHELESDIEPFKGLLLGLFFIAVGASIDFGLIASQPVLIAELVGILIVVKFIVLFILGRVFKMGLDQNLLFAFGLSQIGEFAFVLLSAANQLNVLEEDVTAPLIAVVAMSMLLTPLVMLINESLVQPRVGTLERVEQREADAIEEDNPVIIAGFGKFGHIVGRLLTANGIGTTVLDNDSDHVDLLRKLGMKVYYGDASRYDLLHAAGAERAKILILAIDNTEKTLEIIHTVRKHFPHLKIFTRAINRYDAYELIEEGVEHVYRETLDTSLRLGVDVMRLLGFRAYQAQRASHVFFRHDEESVRVMAEMHHDHALYINVARERIEDLEQLLRSDFEEREHAHDAAWDVDTLRDEKD